MDQLISIVLVLTLNLLFNLVSSQDLNAIFGNCHKRSPDFDPCIKNAFNELRPYFKAGIPEYNIAPFDPHRNKYVELRRGVYGGFIGGMQLILRDNSEYGWTNSEVTKYKTDWANDRIIYTQYFPVKSLNGRYEFKGSIFGKALHNMGLWNITLYDYAQTTTVTRVGGPGGLIKLRVEIDKLGDLDLQITNLFFGKTLIEKIAHFFINNVWQPGFPFVKPLINELVSSAFTDIFNESFRYFPLDQFIHD